MVGMKHAILGGVVSAALLLSTQALATPTQVPVLDIPFGAVSVNGNVSTNHIGGIGGVLTGTVTDVCTPPGVCSITFGGFKLIGLDSTYGYYTGGTVTFKVNGQTVLTGDAQPFSFNGHSGISLYASNGSITKTNGVGQSYVNVTGGTLAQYFDTNKESFGSDFSFSLSDILASNSNAQPATGRVTLNGFAVNPNAPIGVPEPGSLGMFGLGLATLLGLGWATRRRTHANVA